MPRHPSNVDGPQLPTVVIDAQLGNDTVSLGKWRMWVNIYGPIAAAWLVRQKRMRDSIRRCGAFEVTIGPTVKLSLNDGRHRWFKLAVSLFRKRPTWRVREEKKGNKTVYRFHWLLSRHSKDKPDVAKFPPLRLVKSDA